MDRTRASASPSSDGLTDEQRGYETVAAEEGVAGGDIEAASRAVVIWLML
jgi:hypothetical protein